MDILALGAAAGSGYYATKMIFYMKRGRMERPWQYLSAGAILLVVGSVFFSVMDVVPAYGDTYLSSNDLGTGLTSLGFFLLLLGFRSLYGVWTLKDIEKERKNSAISR